MRPNLVLFALSLYIAIIPLGCSIRRDADDDHTLIVRPITVEVDTVRADAWPDIWEASGFVRRGEPVTLSSRMTGVVRTIAVQKGDRVRAGALLMAFDISDVEASIRQTEAAKPKPSEALRKAGEAMREAATITAPSAGEVVEVFAVQGRLVPRDMPLLRFVPTDLYFETAVDLPKLGEAAVDSPVTLSLDKNCAGAAKVIAILDHPVSGKKIVRTSLPPCKVSRLNMRGNIRFEGEPQPVVTVAEAALVVEKDRTSVFLVEDGFARFRRITAGEKRGDRTEAIAGLVPRSKVVIRPPADLKDNSPVVIADRSVVHAFPQ